MMKVDELLDEADQLPAAEKWHLVRRLLQSLEAEQKANITTTDWHEFLNQTYGSLADDPIERGEQGEYEECEPLE